MGDEGRVDVVLQDDGVLALLLEHVDVLALLHLVGHIENRSLFRLFFFVRFFAGLRLFCLILCGCLVGVLYDIHILRFSLFLRLLFRHQIL